MSIRDLCIQLARILKRCVVWWPCVILSVPAYSLEQVFGLAALLLIPFLLLAPTLSASIQFDYLSPRDAVRLPRSQDCVPYISAGINSTSKSIAHSVSRRACFTKYPVQGSTLGYHILVQKFGAGVAFPNKLLIVAAEGETVMSREFFERAGKVVANLASLPGQPHADYQGVLYSTQGGIGQIKWLEMEVARRHNDTLCRELIGPHSIAQTYLDINWERDGRFL